jgi:hypothetical protein
MFSSSSKIMLLSVVVVGLLVSACAVSSEEEDVRTTQQRLDTGSTHAGPTIDCADDANKGCIECGGRSEACCRTDDCDVTNKPPPPPAPTQVRPVPRPLPPIQGTFTSTP